ncbi:YqcI/YcgG family protein [Virgibacillus senegalensis]|uniref:YqcI/YcgG family protein n=1 Tax=Virgibacillus senegalensis TaxID=1499679 RepID=UPI00069D9F55|nr:YqcI/YcgG family protein [Virgibacillus senegalensis]
MKLYTSKDLLKRPEEISDFHYANYHAFLEKLADKKHRFPCIPALQGAALQHFRFGFLPGLTSDHAVDLAANLLAQYSHSYKEYGRYTSLILFFEDDQHDTVRGYERLFWKLLTDLHQRDPLDWPDEIPVHPAESLWEYCFYGERYFLYTATPSHQKRKSRSFPCFLLAFTPRWAFEQFNHQPSSPSIKEKIRERLTAYDEVPPHPDLNTYGQEDNFEAKQYFLRDDQTSSQSCPFHQRPR